jgi:hypothetical protein
MAPSSPANAWYARDASRASSLDLASIFLHSAHAWSAAACYDHILTRIDDGYNEAARGTIGNRNDL